MKKAAFILLILTVFNCSSDDNDFVATTDIPEATILGRWVLVGFEDTIRYEFTETKRFDIYSTDGTFPTLEEFNQTNPQLNGFDWYYEGDRVTVDLNFGNLSTLTPQFTCNNYVLKWLDDDGVAVTIYHREDYDLNDCTDIE